ncbi:hypothetical protein ACWEPC_19825 [Nonomuraea sp. NPDC004297]
MLAFAGSLALAAPAAQAGTSGATTAKASAATALAICPVKVLRTSPRYYQKSNGTFGAHNFFKKGNLLNIYQGESRKHGNTVVIKTTTVVGNVRFWVNQADIAGTGGACRS